MKEMNMVDKNIDDLVPYKNNSRVHDKEQLEYIKNSIKEFGFIAPVVIDENNMILVGHGRVMAAKELGLEKVPCVCVDNLNESQKKAYILSDNLLTERGSWDLDKLNNEIDNIDLDMSSFGFDEIEENINDIEISDDLEDELITCPKCGYQFNGGETDE